jgi:KipI family sensor histidine kinase inhibitor
MGEPRLALFGDSTLVLQLGDTIDPIVNARVIALAAAAREAGWAGVRDIVPTFRSVAVAFDPVRADAARIAADLEHLARVVEPIVEDREPLAIPVCYGGDLGPDLDALSHGAGCRREDVVDLHASVTYRVYMLGFVPGFAYMGVVDSRIRASRHTAPRVRVPAGSVGIAGAQTAIYPMETPGGWQIIGRTPVAVCDLARAEPFLFRAGDRVRFEPIDRETFEGMARP